MTSKKTGIIFDMDGTLWDTGAQVAESWNVVLKKKGVKQYISKEEVYAVMGKTMDDIADIIFKSMDKKEDRISLLDECCVYENEYLREHGGVLYENLESTMETLKKKYSLSIVSNCQSGYIEAFLEHYHLEEFFDTIECFGNNGLPKWENIALVKERLQLDKAYYVGDIQGDYEASKKANTEFIHAAYGFGTIDDVVPRIEKLEDLVSCMRKLENL